MPVALLAQVLAWFSSGLGKILLYIFFVLGVILLPVTIWQTTQIYGFNFSLPIIGRVTIITGLEAQVATADTRIRVAHDETLATSIACTKATNELKLAGDQAVTAQKAKTDSAEAALVVALTDAKKFHNLYMRILNNAKPEDVRPLGPVALQYLGSLRAPH